jgi:hypothetical protein
MGIDETNTLFIFTPDEGDHFVGVSPTPANCDGAKIDKKTGDVTGDVYCTYPPNPATGELAGIGELDVNILAVTQAAPISDPTVYTVHSDDSVTTYVNGQPLFSSSDVRTLEKGMAGASLINPHTGVADSFLGTGLGPNYQGAIVDPVGMKLLHMNTVADPNREPTFTLFANPDYFFSTFGSASPTVGNNIGSGFAWNHGDIQEDIRRTFIGIAGPGVKNLGITQPTDFFTDHADVRPTMMALVGLTDNYQHDGRVITEMLDNGALPKSLTAHQNTLESLGQVYKQINAPFGDLADDTLTVSTYAITSTSSGDKVYNKLESVIADWTAERDGLVAQIKPILQAAEFSGISLDEKQAKAIITQAQALLTQADACAANPSGCAE